MELKWVWLGLTIVLSEIGWCNGCWEQERLALLQLKPFFNSSLALQNWVDGDCCKWERVECSSTGRVIKLSLNNTKAYGSEQWYLNASLFLPFQEIKSLYLKGNYILGCVPNEGFERLSTRLSNLEVLDLSYNFFNDTLLPSLNGLSSLKSLNLGSNQFKVPIQPQDLPTSENLEDLYLDKIPLNNSLLHKVGAMTSLKVLSMSGCGLNGKLPIARGLCELINLRVLDMSNNDLQGTLPWCLINLTSLQLLDISSNQFVGNISQSPLARLTSLVDLELSNNHFQIPFSLGPFFNHSNLKHINGQNNEIYVETELLSAPKFQLNSILLSSCRNCTGAFPKFLYHQHDLQIVDLSYINLKGEFPNWLLTNNTRLEAVFLINNSLSGPLHLPLHPHINLLALDISNNFFQSLIPLEIGAYLPELKLVNMSRNDFDGSIPSSFGNMKSVVILDLSNNQLFGIIPEHLAIGCFSLHALILSNNNLQGHIFSGNFNLTKLWWLQLDGNKFSGRIPDSLSKSSLSILDLSHNHFSGKIPVSISNLSNLQNLIMSNNHLEGPIPLDFCQLQYLEVLDLAKNNVSGVLPSCFRSSSIRHVHLSDNRIEGPLTNATFDGNFLVTLDLSNNHITGKIPDWISGHSGLKFLLLKNNNFEGEIPDQMCQLSELSLIDLSRNNLSGSIPPCLCPLEQVDVLAPDVSGAFIPQPETYFLPQRSLDFTTKHFSYAYKGKILSYMSGIDLSCNKLTGKIPSEIGNLSKILTLNLSYNSFTGSIPSTFSNLKKIESLDLSHNHLDGEIPSQLITLNFLSVFSVAHNNLSGKTPERTEQFATFEASSYEGNPFLCGLPLPRSCTTRAESSERDDKDGGFLDIDMNTFYASFTVSYIFVLLGIFLVLYINVHWRRAWFCLIEICINSCTPGA